MIRLLSAVAASLAAVACGFVGPDDTGCFAGEFPARCAIVEGVVTDSTGSPMGGMTVGPRYIVDDCCTTTYATTGASGAYSFRIARAISLGEQGTDTLTLFVAAGRVPEGWIDSVAALVTFATPPVVTEVNLQLAR